MNLTTSSIPLPSSSCIRTYTLQGRHEVALTYDKHVVSSRSALARPIRRRRLHFGPNRAAFRPQLAGDECSGRPSSHVYNGSGCMRGVVSQHCESDVLKVKFFFLLSLCHLHLSKRFLNRPPFWEHGLHGVAFVAALPNGCCAFPSCAPGSRAEPRCAGIFYSTC